MTAPIYADFSFLIRQIEADLAEDLRFYHALPWMDALRQAEQLSADHADRLGSGSAGT